MSWIRGLSIRTRITIGTLVVALAVSAIAGLLLRLRVEAIVHETTVQLLEADLSPIEATIRKNPTNPQIAAGEGQLVAVLDPDGHAVLSNLPDSLQDVFPKLKRLHYDPTPVSNDGKHFLVSNERVETAAGAWYIIVARSLEPGDLVISQLGVTLVIGSFVLFVIFGAASWILSGAALRPVSRMRRQADLLGRDARLSGESLPVGPARDELAALARTLNEFLDRNRKTMVRERQMISDASHELRTPLAVLSAQLGEAASAGSRGGDIVPLVANAQATARRLSRLATNLLELSQIEARGETTESSWAQLALETAASIDRARLLAEPHGIIVDFEVAEESDPATWPVAASNFGRLADNLLTNAINASPNGSTVTLHLGIGAGGLVLTVIDHGPGMPESFIPIAFDRFTRPDDARARKAGGSGLGLAIVAAIAAASGGVVRLRNTHPGLRVTVELPRRA